MKPVSRKNKASLALWTTFPVLFGVFLASFVLSGFKIEKIFPLNKSLQATIVQLIAPSETSQESQYFYVNKNETGAGPSVSAKAFLVGDLNTGEVILAKNQDGQFPIASTSKLMTALVATELALAPDDPVLITKEALTAYGTNGELKLGEKIKVSDIFYPLLLESSNDAAEALAIHFGRENFIAKMNTVADQLLMTKTFYEDPSGLTPHNQSTASDLFKLTGYLFEKHPDLFKITTKRSYSNKKHSWSNTSQFLGEDGYLGSKSGYTDAAKQTVVSLFNLPLGQSEVRPIAITLLQSDDRHKDIEAILKYLKKNIYYGGKRDANTNWVKERVGMPDIKDPSFVTLSFAGDIMLDRGVKNSVIRNFNNDYSALFEKIDTLKKSDISFANLEGTASDLGVDQKNLYSFRMDPSIIPALKGAGIGVLSVANNHVADWGASAFVDTLARLKENEILYTGGGNNKLEAETPAIIEKYGMKIGFLGFSDVGPNYMTAETDTAGVLLASDPNFDQIIQNATKLVDHLVVSFHFGEEYKPEHNVRQEFLAHRAIDDGAKIVIGSHPHVVQDTEVYKNSFIAYSLGNFVFDQSWSKPTMQGMLLEIKLFRDGTMSIKKNITQLSPVFQLNKIIQGKEEKVKFISQ